MSSVNPETLAIGGAVVVAGVGAYFLLRSATNGSGSGTDSNNPVTGIIAGVTGTGGILGDTDDCPLPDNAAGNLTAALEGSAFAKFCAGVGIGYVTKKIVTWIQDIPSMDELNQTRKDAFTAGKAAIQKNDYKEACNQYAYLLKAEDQVLENREASGLTSHEKDPYCKNPLSAQLLKLMMPMMTDVLTKQFNDLLDTAEANVKAGNFTVAGGNLWAFDTLFSKFYSGGGSDLPFTAKIKARYDSLREDVDAGKATKTVASSEDRIMSALDTPGLAPRLLVTPEEWRVFNGILPVYQMYLAKKDAPDVNVRLDAAKALLSLPTWFINTPKINAFIMKTRDDMKQQKKNLDTVSAATASVASTAKTIGAGLEHLLADNAYAIMAEQWVKMSLDQQKAYTAQLTQEQKDKLRQAILARKAREGR